MNRVYVDINPKILRCARERARYPQEQLARKVGVSTQRYRLWEAGDINPTSTILQIKHVGI